MSDNGAAQAIGEDVAVTAEAAAPVTLQQRISSLDFIRGLAVMGILAANIVAFGQPASAYFWPEAFLVDASDPGGFQWIAQFVLIDGKMRGLFTLLFGAGMYLFMERAWERGSSRWLQFWRLVLLLGFGLFHFYLIWFGDILAMYAMIGFLALLFMRLQPATQIRIGLFLYTLGAILLGGVFLMQYLIAETQVSGPRSGLPKLRARLRAPTKSRRRMRQSHGAYAKRRLSRPDRGAFRAAMVHAVQRTVVRLYRDLVAYAYRHGALPAGFFQRRFQPFKDENVGLDRRVGRRGDCHWLWACSYRATAIRRSRPTPRSSVGAWFLAF